MALNRIGISLYLQGDFEKSIDFHKKQALLAAKEPNGSDKSMVALYN